MPNVKYLTDENGEKTAVVIDIKEWQLLQEELERLRQQEALKGQIERGMKDVGAWKQGEKDLSSLKNFLEHEC